MKLPLWDAPVPFLLAADIVAADEPIAALEQLGVVVAAIWAIGFLGDRIVKWIAAARNGGHAPPDDAREDRRIELAELANAKLAEIVEAVRPLADFTRVARQVEDLHDWHNHDDPDNPGVKIWWQQRWVYSKIRDIAVRLGLIEQHLERQRKSSGKYPRPEA